MKNIIKFLKSVFCKRAKKSRKVSLSAIKTADKKQANLIFYQVCRIHNLIDAEAKKGNRVTVISVDPERDEVPASSVKDVLTSEGYSVSISYDGYEMKVRW